MGAPDRKNQQTAGAVDDALALQRKGRGRAVAQHMTVPSGIVLDNKTAWKLGKQAFKMLGDFRDDKELARLERDMLNPTCMQTLEVNLNAVIFNALQGHPNVEDMVRAANVDPSQIKMNASLPAATLQSKRPGKVSAFFSAFAPKR